MQTHEGIISISQQLKLSEHISVTNIFKMLISRQNIIKFACCSVVQWLVVQVGTWLDSELLKETALPEHVHVSHTVTTGIGLQVPELILRGC